MNSKEIEQTLDMIMEKITESQLFFQFYLENEGGVGSDGDWQRFVQPLVHAHIFLEKILKMRCPTS